MDLFAFSEGAKTGWGVGLFQVYVYEHPLDKESSYHV